jgi:hypothetical protein
MGPGGKREILELLRRSPLPKRQMLVELGLAASNYYRCSGGIESMAKSAWWIVGHNPEWCGTGCGPRRKAILAATLREPDRGPRELPHAAAGFAATSCAWLCRMNRHSSVSKKSGALHRMHSGLFQEFSDPGSMRSF